jgi:5-(carboxyamino)imidazole ribonucleotide synthase
VIGGGQLARMMGEAAESVNVELHVLATSMDDCAVTTCHEASVGDAKDASALAQFGASVDVVTFDHELVDLEQIAELEKSGVVVRPSSNSLRYSVNKAFQRQEFKNAGLPVPKFLVVSSIEDSALNAFLDELGTEPVVKASHGGYDGRGVLFPENRDETFTAIKKLSKDGPVLIEERLELEGEVAQLIARDVNGKLAVYPLVTTVQRDGMCIEVRYPSHASDDFDTQAKLLGEQIAQLMDVVGIFAIEFFVTEQGLVINEVALRPHNSGHWTIEGTETSQFQNHLLAVSGQELGPIETTGNYAVMVNIIGGDAAPTPEKAAAIEDVHVHDYAKEWKPDRKLGHITVIGHLQMQTLMTGWAAATAYGTKVVEEPL